jgi:site-specific recombinase XerC
MSCRNCLLAKSTLLGGLRSATTCRNAGSHSGGHKVHGKDGVAGSIPAGGSTHRLTSANAGQFRFSGCFDWPHNGNWPHPLTCLRLRYGPAMTPDHTPSLLRSFERHLRAENRADNTIESYLESIRQAEAFLAAHGRTLLDARRADLEAFLGDLLRRRAPATAATRYKVLRILYAWLEEEEEITASPMAKMRPPIVPEQPVPIVPEDGLRRLLAACGGKHFEGRRDTAIVMFLLDTGARRAELVGLRLADLDLDLDVAIVLGKGRRERALPFGRKTAVALDRYLRGPGTAPGRRAALAVARPTWSARSVWRPADPSPPRRRGRPPRPARAPTPPHLRPRLARPRRRRNRPDAACRLEVPPNAWPLRRLGRRRPRPRGASAPLAWRPSLVDPSASSVGFGFRRFLGAVEFAA